MQDSENLCCRLARPAHCRYGAHVQVGDGVEGRESLISAGPPGFGVMEGFARSDFSSLLLRAVSGVSFDVLVKGSRLTELVIQWDAVPDA